MTVELEDALVVVLLWVELEDEDGEVEDSEEDEVEPLVEELLSLEDELERDALERDELSLAREELPREPDRELLPDDETSLDDDGDELPEVSEALLLRALLVDSRLALERSLLLSEPRRDVLAEPLGCE